ncbi:hypothetical protein Tco_1213403 [Tanacetum coccineum]
MGLNDLEDMEFESTNSGTTAKLPILKLGWFVLYEGRFVLFKGCSPYKGDAFTPKKSNGEAWNNIACLHMTKKTHKQALIVFNLILIMEEKFVIGESGIERSRETEQLTELIGKILQQIAKSGGGGDVWGVFARWHKLKGDLAMCSEALLKQVRSYQGSELWKEKERFVKFARASLELCKVYVEISSRNGGRRELFAAEMHLKSTVKQAALSFSETEEFISLQAFLEKVQAMLQAANSVALVKERAKIFGHVLNLTGHKKGNKSLRHPFLGNELQELDETLHIEIQAAFRAHEIRRIPLTPQDEMRAGMSRATSIKQSGRVFLNSYGS